MSKTRIVKTTCSICGPCCEVDAYVEDGKLAGEIRRTSQEACARKGRQRFSMSITKKGFSTL